MKNSLKTVFLFLLAVLPVVASANWSDPSVVPSQNRVKLGEGFTLKFFNAPTGASLIIYPQKGTPADAVATKAVTTTKGQTKMTIPADAGAHAYYIALCTGSGSDLTLLGDPAYVLADEIGSGFSLTTDKVSYARNGSINVTFENAPACANDRIVMYPVAYKLVPETDKAFAAPTLSTDVTAASGSVILKTATAGYYNIYYLVDGSYYTIFDVKTVLVGSPATIKVIQSTYAPEEEVVINYSGLSKVGDDWIGVFPKDSNYVTCEPAYRVNLKGHASGKITIPTGTLPNGTYKATTFFNEERNATATLVRFTISSKSKLLEFSNDSVETYYTIQSAADNRYMTGNTGSSKLKNMTLGTDGTAQVAQWKVIDRGNGTLDFVNRATGDFLLTYSAVSGNYNMTKMGSTPDETHHGWNVSLLGSEQYTIHGYEEDGVQRYLANSTIASGSEPAPLNLQTDGIFAWKFNTVETVVTAIKGHNKTKGESIKVVNGKIVVTGNQDYTTWNASGLRVANNTELPAGIYLVKWKDGRSAKVNVK